MSTRWWMITVFAAYQCLGACKSSDPEIAGADPSSGDEVDTQPDEGADDAIDEADEATGEADGTADEAADGAGDAVDR